MNRVTSLTYPDNEVVNYTYDPAGNLKTVSNYVTDTTYTPLGQRDVMTLGNGVVTDYNYDPNHFRLSQIYTTKTSTVHQNLNFAYDAVGNVLCVTDGSNGANTQSFSYDHLNRLVGAHLGSCNPGTYEMTYSYNEIGNMTSNSQVGSYTYPASGASSVRPHAVTSAGPNTYAYDANGNMVSGAGRTMIYDAENRPTSITGPSGTTQMVYDYSGDRLKKTEPTGSTTTYISSLYECTASGCAKYIFAGGTRIALKDASNQVYYYHTDHLGSSTVVTYGSGPVTDPAGPPNGGDLYQQLAYYPYGQTRVNSLCGGSGEGCTSGVKHKYTGQEQDNSTALMPGGQADYSTSLYYYGARYYDPVIGRFISADTVTGHSSQKLNRYSYVLNNPMRYIDPSGHSARLSSWMMPPSWSIPTGMNLGPMGPTTYQGMSFSYSSVEFGGYNDTGGVTSTTTSGMVSGSAAFARYYAENYGGIFSASDIAQMTPNDYGFWNVGKENTTYKIWEQRSAPQFDKPMGLMTFLPHYDTEITPQMAEELRGLTTAANDPRFNPNCPCIDPGYNEGGGGPPPSENPFQPLSVTGQPDPAKPPWNPTSRFLLRTLLEYLFKDKPKEQKKSTP